MTTIADYGHDHLLVLLVVSENFLEAVAELVERVVSSGTGLEDAGLDLGHAEGGRVHAVGALPFGATMLGFEEVTVGAAHEGVHFVVSQVVATSISGGLG